MFVTLQVVTQLLQQIAVAAAQQLGTAVTSVLDHALLVPDVIELVHQLQTGSLTRQQFSDALLRKVLEREAAVIGTLAFGALAAGMGPNASAAAGIIGRIAGRWYNAQLLRLVKAIAG